MFSMDELEDATHTVYAHMAATPAYSWPLLREAMDIDLIVKHENFTPTGAFKVRGGLVFTKGLKARDLDCKGIVSATRGNHGQSLAFAGRHFGVPVTIFVPEGNSREKNAAMRAFGAQLIEHGTDFDEAVPAARAFSEEHGLTFVPSFHKDLVRGVATYAYELFTHHNDIDTVFVPIGLGSGICGLIRTRDLMGLKTKIVGVVSEGANAYAQSLEAGCVTSTNRAHTFADGMAVRVPNPDAFAIIKDGVDRIVTVSDQDVADAIRLTFLATHTVAEGAGAAPLAAVMREKEQLPGQKVAVIQCGQNIDREWFQSVLAGETPTPL